MLFFREKFQHLKPIERLKTEKFYLENELPYFENNHPDRKEAIERMKKRLSVIDFEILRYEDDFSKSSKTLKSVEDKIKHIEKRLQELTAQNNPLNNPIIEIFENELQIAEINNL